MARVTTLPVEDVGDTSFPDEEDVRMADPAL